MQLGSYLKQQSTVNINHFLKGKTITSDKSHSSFVITAKKVSESIVISSYEKNKKQAKNYASWL